jgi:hypothetical protein
VQITPPETINTETIDQFAKTVEGFKEVPVVVSVQPGTAVSDMQAILDSLPDTKNVTIEYTLPDGTTITTGSQKGIDKIINPNDQTTA